MWFADEARVGQKNKYTRRWARFGGQAQQQPPFAQGPRTASTCLFGAICPKDGKGAGVRQEMRPPDSFLIRFTLPLRNTQAIGLHLAEISGRVAPGRHALLLLDQAGWHVSHPLVVPENITLLPLPPKCPEPCVAKNSPPDCFLNAPHRSRISGSSCATTGCQTASSPTRATSSTPAAKPGTTSQTAALHHLHRDARLGPWVVINDALV